jgi:hypothetical protein
MTEFTLSDGNKTLIDDEDVGRVREFTWFLHKQTGYVMGYVTFGRGRVPVYLHRWLLAAPKGAYVDHSNKAKTDNRKANIRICSQRQNLLNGDMARRKATSKFRGVSASRYQWRARVCDKTIGYFASEEEAASAYDGVASEIAPGFAQLNFPSEV